MKIASFFAAMIVTGSAAAADPPPQQPADPCKSGLPWVLPKVEPGMDVSEQYLLLGATSPVQMTVCHCTPATAGKPTPHVWVNVTKRVVEDKQPGESRLPAVPSGGLTIQHLEKYWKDNKGRTPLEFLSSTGNTVVVSRLHAPACMITNGLSVLVMHSNKEEDRLGTSSTK